MEMKDLRKTIKTFFILFYGPPEPMNKGYACLQCRIKSTLDSKWTLV